MSPECTTLAMNGESRKHTLADGVWDQTVFIVGERGTEVLTEGGDTQLLEPPPVVA